MKRRLFTLFAAASLLMCIGTFELIGLGLLGHEYDHTARHADTQTSFRFRWGADYIYFERGTQIRPRPTLFVPFGTSHVDFAGFHLHWVRDMGFRMVNRKTGLGVMTSACYGRYTALTVRLWWVLLLSAIPPLLWFFGWWRRTRHVPGTCRKCGYDLRATPERCPECGTPAVKKVNV